MKIKKDDTVLIISGKDREKRGKVLRVLPKEKRILVEGINLRKKHQKAKKSGEKGQIVEMPSYIHISNIELICPQCGKSTRVGYKIISNSKNQKSKRKFKIRICKKCKGEI